jgi:KaiC/GvpD/RAD55 family RecA-like ATPase/predicted flap endonuclease-1-like 5' DNA nuclease
MPKDAEQETEETRCPICGHTSPEGSRRCENCYTQLQEGDASGNPPSQQEEKELAELRLIPGVGEAKADVLHEAGYKSVKDIRKASVDDLASVKGIGEKLATKIIEGANSLDSPDNKGLQSWLSGEDNGLSEWLSGDENSNSAPATARAEVAHDDSLAKWLSGEEQDVNIWLEEARTAEPVSEEIGPNELLAREAEIIQLRETLRQKLKEFESGEFDPQATVEELAKARGELEAEKRNVQHLQEELENVKRGSIAVIKYIKSQQGSEVDQSALTDKLAAEMANRENLELKIMQLEEVVSTLKERIENMLTELPPEEEMLQKKQLDLAERNAELNALRKQLLAKEEALSRGAFAAVAGAPGPSPSEVMAQSEAWSTKEKELIDQVRELESKLSAAEVGLKQKEELMKFSEGKGKGIDEEMMRKLEDAQRTERTLVVRGQEVQRLREDLKIREEELKKLKEPMRFKEEEMLRREEDLMFREKLLQGEQKRLSVAQAELGSQDEITLKKRLEELQAEVTSKEEVIRAKEKYLSSKEEELRMREQGVISEEIEKREADRSLEVKLEKVKTGTARLDDLLLGGIPFGTNVLIYGPPFTGKEVLLSAFVAEGLKKGIPALWVITEKSPKEIREEMMFVVSGYEEYEKLGLVRYVDAYSRSMGDETQDPYTEYIESPTDYESIQKAIENAANAFKDKHAYYRVGFRSISTLIAYLDPGTAFRFLSPVVGRRKRDRAVGMYTIEKGVHGEQEIQMIGSVMDGMIEFKVENLNTFLSVKGIGDVQSRAFIRYSATKSAVTIGSFSLDHIR